MIEFRDTARVGLSKEPFLRWPFLPFRAPLKATCFGAEVGFTAATEPWPLSAADDATDVTSELRFNAAVSWQVQLVGANDSLRLRRNLRHGAT